jgi:hypothetical protein
MAGPSPTKAPIPSAASAAAAATTAPTASNATASSTSTTESGGGLGGGKGACPWDLLLAGAGDDLLTCVFAFLEVEELARV